MSAKQRDTASDAIDSTDETVEPTTPVEEEFSDQLDALRAKALGDFDEVKRVAQSFIEGTRQEILGFTVHYALLIPIQEAVKSEDMEHGLAAIKNYMEHIMRYNVHLAQHNEITDLMEKISPIIQAHGIKEMGKYLLGVCRAAR